MEKCIVCGEWYSIESGAEEGFTCDCCIVDKINENLKKANDNMKEVLNATIY